MLPPTNVSYSRHLDKVKIEVMNRKFTEFVIRHHIKYIDYTHDARFSLSDFTWEMPDHINARGTMKFGKILDDEVIKAQW